MSFVTEIHAAAAGSLLLHFPLRMVSPRVGSTHMTKATEPHITAKT